MKTFRLMVKSHNITGLKYLCISSRNNWESYLGSGTFWKNHLKKYGTNISTTLLFECSDYEYFVEVCCYYSELYNVVKCNDFANIIPESGYGDHDRPNLVLFWELASEDVKDEIYKRRANSLKFNGNHWSNTDKKELTISKIRDKNSLISKLKFDSMSDHEYDSFISEFKGRMKQKFDFMSVSEYNSWKTCISDNMKAMWANMTESERLSRAKSISEGRLAMSDSDKESRARKVSESFRLSSKRLKFVEDMKTTRTGENNPNAKIYVWFGVNYTAGEFKKLKVSQKLDSEYIADQFENNPDCRKPEDSSKSYEKISCPHCKKSCESKPSSFKRWHFDNCKEKV